MRTPSASADHFLSLHRTSHPLLMPNAWDIGSAVLLASLGFEALATTSGGFAATRGRLDGSMTQGQVLEHVGEIAAATDLPVSADLENCFAHDPEGVAETVTQAVDMGVAGCSVEDYSGRNDEPIYELAHAAERVRGGRRSGPPRWSLGGADCSGRELPSRPAGSGRHHRPPAGLSGSGRRRALRSPG